MSVTAEVELKWNKERLAERLEHLSKCLREDAVWYLLKTHYGYSEIGALVYSRNNYILRPLESKPVHYTKVFNMGCLVEVDLEEQTEAIDNLRKRLTTLYTSYMENTHQWYNAVYMEFHYDEKKGHIRANVWLYFQNTKNMLDEMIQQIQVLRDSDPAPDDAWWCVNKMTTPLHYLRPPDNEKPITLRRLSNH